ncbi:nuclear transport factor 2 family protein [Gordonia sp. NPDC127522]|uniref:nuclear transport factor 2 family protein n=1 Tax=Gordonia sp. NPDC127522 TaxID=3345390 RepID=UPI0036273F3D
MSTFTSPITSRNRIVLGVGAVAAVAALTLSGCSTTTEDPRNAEQSHSEANERLVRELYESNGDPAAFEELAAPDLVWDITPGFPFSGVYTGPQGVVEYFGQLMPAVDEWPTIVEDYFAAGDERVFVTGHYAPTNDGETVQIRFVHEWTVEDGVLTGMRQAADSAIARDIVDN